MVCKNCGKDINDKAVVCIHCGNRVKKKKTKLIIIILSVCILRVLFIFVSITASNNAFNNDMTNAADYITSGEFDKAKEILDKQLDTNSSQKQVYMVFADYYLAQNEYLQAVEILEDGLSSCLSDDEIQKKLDDIESNYAVEIAELETKRQLEEQERQEAQELEKQKQQEALEFEKQKEKDNYIAKCQHVKYEDLARNPNKYKGVALAYTGKIIQVLEPTFGNTVTLRINVTENEYGFYSDTIYATVKLPSDADRLLKDDIITIYGDCDGLYSYTSILGASVSIPKIDILYFELNT